MTKSFFPVLCILLTCLFSCKDQPKEQPATDNRLDFTFIPGERFGLITPQACTREAVLAAYGDSAKVDNIYIIDGMVDEGVVLFPNSPRNMVSIWWDKDNEPNRPAFIRIQGDSTGATDWKSPNGLTLGTPLAEVERLNGKPFKLSGFGWDYGGRATDWQGGKLVGSGLFFVFSPAGATDDKLVGETTFDSNDPLAAQANVTVASIEMSFLAKEKLPACLEEKVKAAVDKNNFLVVRKMLVNGKDHFWFSDGAAAYDGLEYIYDAECNQLCSMGGMRQQPQECEKVYENGKWEPVWEYY